MVNDLIPDPGRQVVYRVQFPLAIRLVPLPGVSLLLFPILEPDDRPARRIDFEQEGRGTLSFSLDRMILSIDDIPNVSVDARRADDGFLTPRLRVHDRAHDQTLSLEDARRLIDAWEKTAGGSTTRDPWNTTLAEYLQAWAELRPNRKRQDLIDKLAGHFGVTTRTIRNWHRKRGWPLSERVEDLDTENRKLLETITSDGTGYEKLLT